MQFRSLLAVAALGAAACADQSTAPESGAAPATASARADAVGAVFALTNAVGGNEVVAFARGADGSLTRVGAFPTGGAGTGTPGSTNPLASQHAVIVSRNAQLVFAVNAGSNSVASFTNDHGALTLADVVASGGERPVSLAASSRVLYVLNQANSAVALFDIGRGGRLTPRPSSETRTLGRPEDGVPARGAQLKLSHDGRFLIAIARGTNTLEVFPVLPGGALGTPTRGDVTLAAGGFGFDVTPRGDVIVSEAGGQSASSFALHGDGSLTYQDREVVSQGAPCWLITTPDGRFAYTANAGGASISGLAVAADGNLTLITPGGRTASTGLGSSPLDLDVSRDGKFLYVLEGGSGNIMSFAIANDGTLTSIGEPSGVNGRLGQMGVAAY